MKDFPSFLIPGIASSDDQSLIITEWHCYHDSIMAGHTTELYRWDNRDVGEQVQ